MSRIRQNYVSSNPKVTERIETGKTLSKNSVEFRIDDGSTTFKKHTHSGGKWVQILSAILLNFLAMGTGASYGILNVCSSKLDAKKCSSDKGI